MSFLAMLFSKKNASKIEGIIETPLDMVAHAASLASNPRDIDPLLDRVRTITSGVSASMKDMPEDQQLVDVYLRIERYLTTDEPIRIFHKEELRRPLSPSLVRLITVHEKKFNRSLAR